MRSNRGSAGLRLQRPDGGGLRAAHDSPNAVLTDASIRAISAAVIAAMRLLILVLSTARNWSQSATELAPSEGIATMIGGATLGELESGITPTVRRAAFIASSVRTRHGRRPRCWLPKVGSRSTQTVNRDLGPLLQI